MRQLPFPETQDPESALGQIVEHAQDRQFDIGTAAFDTSTIGERQIKLALISGSLYIYTRYDGTVYRTAALTAV